MPNVDKWTQKTIKQTNARSQHIVCFVWFSFCCFELEFADGTKAANKFARRSRSTLLALKSIKGLKRNLNWRRRRRRRRRWRKRRKHISARRWWKSVNTFFRFSLFIFVYCFRPHPTICNGHKLCQAKVYNSQQWPFGTFKNRNNITKQQNSNKTRVNKKKTVNIAGKFKFFVL